jgi:hypothetical protein
MNRRTTRRLGAAALLAAAATVTPAWAGSTGSTSLTGTLELSPGKAVKAGGRTVYTGTFFRMVVPQTTDQYFSNPQSKAPDHTYTLLSPGRQRGLELGRFQPPPSPAFSGSAGNALADSITQPQEFSGINFSISTAPKDAQSGAAVPAPNLVLRGTKLTGNLTAWTAEWNRIYFNQGSPKPGGSYPGSTQPVTGTYDPRTHAFTITWYSLIVGGPFDGFTGFWHLQGHLEP